MEKNFVRVGQSYIGLAIGVTNYVSGKVIEKLENTVVISVKDFHLKDKSIVNDKLKTVVIRYQDLSEIEHALNWYWFQTSSNFPYRKEFYKNSVLKYKSLLRI